MSMHNVWLAKYARESESDKSKLLRVGRDVLVGDIALSGLAALGHARAGSKGPESFLHKWYSSELPNGVKYDPVVGAKKELVHMSRVAPIAYVAHTLHKKYRDDPEFTLKKLRPSDFLPD